MTRIHLVVLSLGLMFLSFTGCASSNPDFNHLSVPKKTFLVGGGFNIQYTAPCNGVAYWVEETTHKILETQSLKTNERCEFNGKPDVISASLGISKTVIQLTLYFIPDKP